MPEKTINHYRDGMLTEGEALEILDKLQIRGAFREHVRDKYLYIGYDYKNQVWVEIEGF